MFIAYVVVTAITIAANAGIAIVDFARAEFVLANSAEVKVPQSWLPMLATLKAAGAVGLVLGLLGFRAIGIAAAIGLVLFFIGAIAAHLHARVYHNVYGPGAYLGLAVASLVLAAARLTPEEDVSPALVP
ncbi:DoxX family protein [Saccharopolyspora pogona]|uniref:DoxX family protein n=1 Tax=Saccharopolyspora pogona TaxID=333966 RepID=UPI001682477D|nr:DoxX family protein [Saccharopolyspora pogona]